MKRILKSFKYVKLNDILAPFIYLAALPVALFYKTYTVIARKPLYLVCENGKTARDNGMHLFKYIRKNFPNSNCKYVIDKNCDHYNLIKKYGNIVQWHSFKHWIYYLSAKFNLVTQKNANPNQPFFYVLHVIFGLHDNRVFLQHGITKDDAAWLYYKNTKFRYFICGAQKEYDFVKEKFGYPEEHVQYTGFARFDNLIDTSKKEPYKILIMPTWRNWLDKVTEKEFLKTNYYKTWSSFITSEDFMKYLEKNNCIASFYLHSKMQQFRELFNATSDRITIKDLTTDIQDELKSSNMLITDYSSVYMDFAYMKKPVVYYQFDYDEYRKNQYQDGYFSYKDNGFGPVIEKEEDMITGIEKAKTDKEYEKRTNDFFEKRDQDNCKRICELVGIKK